MPLIPPGPPVQIPISNDTPGRIQIAKYIRNGLIPHASFTSQIARSVNHVAALRTKELFRWGTLLQDIPDSDASPRDRWRFCAHTSPLVGAITVVFLMAKQNDGDPVFDPKCTLYLTDATEVTPYGSVEMHYGANNISGVPDDYPSEFSFGTFSITGVPGNTTIYGRIEEDETGRVVAACVYEEGLEVTAANGYVIPSAVAAGSPILGGRQQDLYELTSDMWAQQGAHLFNWTADDQSAPNTTTSATFRNAIDGDSVVSTETPGFTLDTRYCGTRARPNEVPVVFSVRAKSSGGANARIKVKDSAGSTLTTVTLTNTSPEWHDSSFNLPAALDKYDVTMEIDSGQTVSVYAFSMFQLA